MRLRGRGGSHPHSHPGGNPHSRAGFEAVLLENFSSETMVIDGEAYIERYGFEYVDGEWVFSRLEETE